MKNRKTGQLGEKITVDLLLSKGYHILEKNWRYSKAEVDIIAMDKDVLVFVEVKTRKSRGFGPPEDFVSEAQANLLALAANVYMEKIEHDWEIRFDVVAVVLKEGKDPEINHLEDAFFPDWN